MNLFERYNNLDASVQKSVISLIIVNLIPLFGVIFLSWNVYMLLLTYWLESAVIGFYNVVKMLVAKGNLIGSDTNNAILISENKANSILSGVMKAFIIPFFIVHYSGFMFGHLMFIVIFMSINFSTGKGTMDFPALISILNSIWIMAIGFMISHGISFKTNYIDNGEYERTSVPFLMFAPYGRIFVMHITIIFGGFIGIFFIHDKIGSIGFAIVLIFLKTVIDLKAHLKERIKLSGASS